MNWKEFLKPTKLKMFLFAIIIYITWFMPLIPIQYQPDISMCNKITGECTSPIHTSYQATCVFLSNKISRIVWMGYPWNDIKEILIIALMVFLNYLIPCIIFYVYNRVRNK